MTFTMWDYTLRLTLINMVTWSILNTWWRHQMETFSALQAICAGNSPHKGQWRGAWMFSLIYDWVHTREAGDLRRHRAHYDVTVNIWIYE